MRVRTLGDQAADRVTQYKGVVETVAFDLYGCVQVALRPPMNDKGELAEGRWFDVSRVIIEGTRVMEPIGVPYDNPPGPADKPRMR